MPPPVPQRIGVLAAVHFDYESFFKTHKIRNERPKGNLATKLKTGESSIAQRVP